jgi:MFS family permease
MTRPWRDLPLSVRLVLLGDLVNAAGSGLTLPFLFLFFARIRDLGDGTAGLAVGAVAMGALVANVAAGPGVDRWGPRAVLQTGLVLSGAGDLLLLTVHHPGSAIVSAAVYGAGTGAAFPAIAALLGAASPAEHRPTAFALQYALTNIGFSVGTVAAAAMVTFTDPSSFDRLYILDAATFFVFALWLAVPAIRGRRDGASAPDPLLEIAVPIAGYRQVLADRAFRRFCVINALLVVFAFSQFHAALPAIAGGPGGLSAGKLGVVFAANTVTVALIQLPVLARTQDTSRTTMIVLGAGCFALCWVLIGVARQAGAGWPALLLAAVAAAIMGVGETLLSPALGPIVNDLAPEHLRGRYNAVDTIVLSLGSVLGPALTGALLGGGAATALLIVLVSGCLAAAALSGRLNPPVTTGAEHLRETDTRK